MICFPKNIEDEWRVFMVNGKAITGSHYRRDNRLDVYPGVPEEVVEFTEFLDKEVYSQALVYTLDICKCKGLLKVVEVNGFNSSGFYSSDVDRLVTSISELF